MDTCWRLGGLPAFEHLRLRRWAHQLGCRGHVTTKSRTYSTTFGALRGERRDWTHQHLMTQQSGIDPDTPVIVVGDWRYTGPAPGTPGSAP